MPYCDLPLTMTGPSVSVGVVLADVAELGRILQLQRRARRHVELGRGDGERAIAEPATALLVRRPRGSSPRPGRAARSIGWRRPARASARAAAPQRRIGSNQCRVLREPSVSWLPYLASSPGACTTRTRLKSASSSSATIRGRLVRTPWPISERLTTMLTMPSARSRRRSSGCPADRSACRRRRISAARRPRGRTRAGRRRAPGRRAERPSGMRAGWCQTDLAVTRVRRSIMLLPSCPRRP